MNLVERAQAQRKRRQLFSGRPVVLAATRSYQEFLDRVWPGVVLAYNPDLDQFVLQDRRAHSPKGWYVISVMEPREWPTLEEFATHLKSISTSGVRSEWESKRWYDKNFPDPSEQLADLNYTSFQEATIREAARQIGRITNPRPFVYFGG